EGVVRGAAGTGLRRVPPPHAAAGAVGGTRVVQGPVVPAGSRSPRGINLGRGLYDELTPVFLAVRVPANSRSQLTTLAPWPRCTQESRQHLPGYFSLAKVSTRQSMPR